MDKSEIYCHHCIDNRVKYDVLRAGRSEKEIVKIVL